MPKPSESEYFRHEILARWKSWHRGYKDKVEAFLINASSAEYSSLQTQLTILKHCDEAIRHIIKESVIKNNQKYKDLSED